MGGGLVVYWGLAILDMLQIDDVVGAIPVHLFAGIWGTMIVVLSNPDATLFGQAISLAIIIVFVTVTTTCLWVALNLVLGLRVSSESEDIGTDESEMVIAV
jgi:Amt family ammonium transporter